MKNLHAVVKEKNCEACHLRHGIVPKLLLKKNGNEICFGCHAKEKIGLNKSNVHTVLRRGKCTICHDPHASQGSHLLKKEGSEAAYGCHKKEDYEKKVVHNTGSAKGCNACHVAPTSSDQKNLLAKGEPALCLECHDKVRPEFQKAHGNYPVENASCVGCHNPHTSVKPKLLKTSVHDPISGGQCESRHQGAKSDKPFQTTEKGAKLCANCHDPAGLKNGGTIEHQPFKDGA